jgi:hypothetical protein
LEAILSKQGIALTSECACLTRSSQFGAIGLLTLAAATHTHKMATSALRPVLASRAMMGEVESNIRVLCAALRTLRVKTSRQRSQPVRIAIAVKNSRPRQLSFII